MNIFKAWLDTRHFHFEAYAANEADAMAKMLSGLQTHAEQYQVAPENLAIMVDSITVTPVTLGVCYRDHGALPPRPVVVSKQVENTARRFVDGIVPQYGVRSALSRARRMTYEPAYRRKPQWLTRSIEILTAMVEAENKVSS